MELISYKHHKLSVAFYKEICVYVGFGMQAVFVDSFSFLFPSCHSFLFTYTTQRKVKVKLSLCLTT
jgi:hypothetical protein